MRNSEKSFLLAGVAAVLVAGAFILGLGAAAVSAAELPKTMTWTAYGTTSSGYAQSVAIGNMLKSKHGTSLRILPGKNDVSRMTPLKARKVDMCACGVASYFGQEGAMLFAKPGWGPQPLRVLLTSGGTFGLGVATAADKNINTAYDLKGKRVAWVRGGDALNKGASAFLAFAGLTWNDVKKVEFPGFKASADGIINDQVDAAFMSTVTPHAKRIAASPRGLRWPTLKRDDKAGWDRLAKAAPYLTPRMVTTGAEISKDKPWEGAAYPYPILVVNKEYDEEVVYTLVKAMIEGIDDFKNNAPGAGGWALDKQMFSWVIPYHEGAVRYLKEIGAWKSQHQATNDRLLKRQEILAQAWKSFSAKKIDTDDFTAIWLKERATALRNAGMNVVFE